MTSALAFWLMVMISEAMQLGAWKKANPDKPWGKWFHWGIPHFLTNLGVVVVTFALWQGQLLDDVLAEGLSLFGVSFKYQWDQLLPYNPVVGICLGLVDFFADKLAFLFKMFLPSLKGKLGAIVDAMKPKPPAPTTPGGGQP